MSNIKLRAKDDAGNELTLVHSGQIFLYLQDKKRKLYIGKIDKDGRYVKEGILESHIYKKTDSFGFCHEAIKLTNPTGFIMYYNGTIYTLSRRAYERYKTFLHFKKSGFEKQCFVQRKHFNQRPSV